ncbi:MAG: type II toxin-antitoxin system RelE/ParE family toxin [Deltaproteobacteria bacterium]|nr:type II toxin-antitoxin system RelE/ParE family toxin [Deltaproteobacteria bacterium]
MVTPTAYSVFLAPKARKTLDKLEKSTTLMLLSRFVALEEIPYKPRPSADIKKVKGNWSPPMYRLRIGKFRVEYFIDDAERFVYIAEIFQRSGRSDYK